MLRTTRNSVALNTHLVAGRVGSLARQLWAMIVKNIKVTIRHPLLLLSLYLFPLLLTALMSMMIFLHLINQEGVVCSD